MAEITRSTGIPVTAGAYYCGQAGGGYSGITEGLDVTVSRAARLLAEAFGRDVEIRFNSDRRSGGAWLNNSLEGFLAKNCQVGLNAGLYKIRPEDWAIEDMIDAALDRTWPRSERKQRYDALPEEIRVSTRVRVSALRDKSLANTGMSNDCCGVGHDSLGDAIEWLVRNVDPNQILD